MDEPITTGHVAISATPFWLGPLSQCTYNALRSVSNVARWEDPMRNEFTAIIEPDGEWYVAYCPEIPGANGQGRTIAECRTS